MPISTYVYYTSWGLFTTVWGHAIGGRPIMFKPWRHLLAGGIGFGAGHLMHKYETTIEERYKTMIEDDDDDDLFR